MAEDIIGTSLEYTAIILLNSHYQMVFSSSYLSPQMSGALRGLSYCSRQGFMQKPVPAKVQREFMMGDCSALNGTAILQPQGSDDVSEQDTECKSQWLKEPIAKRLFF